MDKCLVEVIVVEDKCLVEVMVVELLARWYFKLVTSFHEAK